MSGVIGGRLRCAQRWQRIEKRGNVEKEKNTLSDTYNKDLTSFPGVVLACWPRRTEMHTRLRAFAGIAFQEAISSLRLTL